MPASISPSTRIWMVIRKRSSWKYGGGVEPVMMQKEQLAIADGIYAAALRDALSHTFAWHGEWVGCPNPWQGCVLALDYGELEEWPLQLSNPGCIVLITHRDLQQMA